MANLYEAQIWITVPATNKTEAREKIEAFCDAPAKHRRDFRLSFHSDDSLDLIDDESWDEDES